MGQGELKKLLRGQKEVINIQNSKRKALRDKVYMEIALVVAQLSTCHRQKVGAILVDPKGRVLALGYNGAPRGVQHCLDRNCLRKEQKIESGTRLEVCRAVHGEMNAIINAAQRAHLVDNMTLYCTLKPCRMCLSAIINVGVKRIIFLNDYSSLKTFTGFSNICNEADVKWEQFPDHKVFVNVPEGAALHEDKKKKKNSRYLCDSCQYSFDEPVILIRTINHEDIDVPSCPNCEGTNFGKYDKIMKLEG
jgi:dCMP deaminase